VKTLKLEIFQQNHQSVLFKNRPTFVLPKMINKPL